MDAVCPRSVPVRDESRFLLQVVGCSQILVQVPPMTREENRDFYLGVLREGPGKSRDSLS